ncbi:MAG: late competence development ComFB family protein [Oscillospiraceae bacterium]|jgi:competence protein ComFB|nr:late competence development ComFB family protein [Oscillospiraceae bacterium]
MATITNMMEKLVDAIINEQKAKTDFCVCETCLADVRCLALNRLPAKYVTTSKGELYSKMDQIMESQNKLDLDIAVISAIEYVCTHKQHPDSKDIKSRK